MINTARGLTQSLHGKWHGRYGTAPCPVCQPEARTGQNALTIAEGRSGLLLHCKRLNCAFCEILAAAGLTGGRLIRPDPMELARIDAERQAQARRRAWQASKIWAEGRPIGGTIAERYLRKRAITCALPDTLRFHPSCWHGATASRHPALVAMVEGCDDFAVHRTYLRPDGDGKASLAPAKAMLGAVAGGAVHLTCAPGPLVVAEGIETALSLACGLLRTPATIWAALSTSGIRGLRLPAELGQLTIAADGDEPGRASAHALAQRAHSTGWTVSLLTAPDGCDWNDILNLKGFCA